MKKNEEDRLEKEDWKRKKNNEGNKRCNWEEEREKGRIR